MIIDILDLSNVKRLRYYNCQFINEKGTHFIKLFTCLFGKNTFFDTVNNTIDIIAITHKFLDLLLMYFLTIRISISVGNCNSTGFCVP